MFWFPKYFGVFFNSAGSAFTLTASHPAHSQNKGDFSPMLKKALLILAAAMALATAISAEILIPPCIPEGTCRADQR